MIKNLSEIKTVKVYNEEGRLVGSHTNISIINIQSFQQGIYWVKIEDLKGNTVIRKLIKTEEK